MWGCGGHSAVQSHSMGGFRGRAEGHTHTHTHPHTHTGTHTHTGMYTRMLHLPFSDPPLIRDGETTIKIQFSLFEGRGLGDRVENRPKHCF